MLLQKLQAEKEEERIKLQAENEVERKKIHAQFEEQRIQQLQAMEVRWKSCPGIIEILWILTHKLVCFDTKRMISEQWAIFPWK